MNQKLNNMKAPLIDLEGYGIKYILCINFHPNTKEICSILVDFMNDGHDLIRMDNLRDKNLFENSYGNIRGRINF